MVEYEEYLSLQKALVNERQLREEVESVLRSRANSGEIERELIYLRKENKDLKLTIQRMIESSN